MLFILESLSFLVYTEIKYYEDVWVRFSVNGSASNIERLAVASTHVDLPHQTECQRVRVDSVALLVLILGVLSQQTVYYRRRHRQPFHLPAAMRF